MNENENLVTEEVAEKVETPTEETPKLYTEAEFNAKLDETLGKKIARKEAKIRKEYERKYGDLEQVLKAGTGKENVEEMTNTFKEFYQKKGIDVSQKSDYTPRDMNILARVEADEIIQAGDDEVIEEVDRLAKIGTENMTAKEKAIYQTLAEHRKNATRKKELASLGVPEEVYNSREFNDFAVKFTSDIPISDIYDIFVKTQPKKEIKTMGSVKNTTPDKGSVKDFYSYEEAQKFTRADFDKNPELFKAVQESMRKWK